MHVDEASPIPGNAVCEVLVSRVEDRLLVHRVVQNNVPPQCPHAIGHIQAVLELRAGNVVRVVTELPGKVAVGVYP